MRRVVLLLCFVPVFIAERSVDTDDEEFKLKFFCGIQDPYDIYNSRLVRVRPQLNMVMNGAGIVNIRNDVFKNCGGALTLSMANNKLANLTGKRLEGLRKLTKANFFNNVIEHVANGTFDALPHLRDLELSYNRLKKLDVGVRNGLRQLRRLHLNRNPIVLTKHGFSGLSKLELLELSGANISDIPSGSFNGLDNLIRLELSSNKLSDISRPDFRGLIQLEELDLSMNQITKISEDTFKGLVNLRYLWLNENRIGSLTDHNIFKHIRNLKNLYFYKNPLQFLDVAVFKKMQSVVIEPGFVVDFSERVRRNFANSPSTLYQCSRLYGLGESKSVNSKMELMDSDETVTTIQYTENEGQNYFEPYYCVILDTDKPVKGRFI